MTPRRINLYLISIIFIASFATVLLNYIDSKSVSDSLNAELNTQNTPLLKSVVKEIDGIPTKKPNGNASRERPIQNDQMVVMHRPDWKLDGNFKDHLEELIIIAANGDSKANYIIAMNLRHCYYAPADDIALDKKLEQAYEYSDADIAVDRITERYKYCFGIKLQQRNQFFKYLEIASNRGYVVAQEIMGSITPELFMKSQGYEELERSDFIRKRDNFIDQKVRYIEQAAQNGSIKALAKLSNMNRSQIIGGNGYVKSYAFNQLILEFTQNNEMYNRYSWFQQKLYPQLTPEEIENALAMSEEWLKKIKINGTLYLND
ncbi:sel1 repeat family protein [Colwellia sp. M166]|uniref:hypothetical protein n=1 Tax=Colwellia sp. M166 TaxID=2583805 RepID=UPI00211DD3D5|nr:hypothetical protein [Colwellia sp. M166]UUO22486.1 sel1 repeat family protein [Colwellia sp. M166]|tara:strand:+ start:429 stop:1382 length:954 start_codon:yes stop_codon:yes gene_type:complete